jgi:hypothetical protein
LPWRIQVGFRARPIDLVIIQERDEVERFFNQSLKQALYLLYGNASVFNNLSGAKQTQMIASIIGESFNFSDYEEVCTELRPRTRDIQLLPVRVLKYGDPRIYQRPITIKTLEDQLSDNLTVQSALAMIMGSDPMFDGWIVIAQGVQVGIALANNS